MVAINFTFFIQMGLFLAFMWLMARYVYTPMLSDMDARDDANAENKKVARESSVETDQLEARLKEEVVNIARDAGQQVYLARRARQEAHNRKIHELRMQEEQHVAEARAAARRVMAEEWAQSEPLTESLAQTMAGCVGVERRETS